MIDTLNDVLLRIEIAKKRKMTNIYSTFCYIMKPDFETGKSVKVDVKYLKGTVLEMGVNKNGSPYLRRNSKIRNKFDIKLYRKNERPTAEIIAIEVVGLKQKNKQFNRRIRTDIKEELFKNNPYCVFTGVKATETDHKDSSYSDPLVSNPKTQTIEHVQGVCRSANTLKRDVCSMCQETNIRFDATKIGEYVPYTMGGKEYDKYGCKGCYYYSPIEFKEQSREIFKLNIIKNERKITDIKT